MYRKFQDKLRAMGEATAIKMIYRVVYWCGVAWAILRGTMFLTLNVWAMGKHYFVGFFTPVHIRCKHCHQEVADFQQLFRHVRYYHPELF